VRRNHISGCRSVLDGRPFLIDITTKLSFILLLLLPYLLFSQSCPTNYNFEDSTTTGWVCKTGWYGTGPCPVPVAGTCPTFNTVLNVCAPLSGAINGLLSTGNDRQTIVSNSYYATGIDPNSAGLIRAVDPLIPGNNYSFRLGDGVTGGTNTTACYTGTCVGPGCYARAEAIRLSFMVDSFNAGFHYHYAVFLANAGHLPEEQPRFEVLVTRPNAGDSLIPCGYYKVVANNSNPYCPGTNSTFHLNGGWLFSDWTDVALDLTSYIGQQIAVEFRTSDCFPGNQPTTTINGGCTTTCQNGVCCTTGLSLAACPDSGLCSGTLVCTNQPGTHSAYAYIDAVCDSSPLLGYNPSICAGNGAVTIHAPTGYASYSWSPINYVSTTDSVVINNPVVGTTYTVDLTSKTGCPSRTKITLHGTDAVVHDTSFCSGTPGTYTLNLIPIANTPVFFWDSTGVTGFSTQQNPVIPIPSSTTTYTITVTDNSNGCTVMKTEKITINPSSPIQISPSAAICAGGTAIITASGGVRYSWSSSPADTTSSISVTPISTTTYYVTVTNSSGCISTDSSTITVNSPAAVVATAIPPSVCQGSSSMLSVAPVAGGQYSWTQSGTGTLNGGTTNTPTVTPNGTETYTVVVTDGNGCIAFGLDTVTVNPNPNPTASSAPPQFCIGDSTNLSSPGGWAQCIWSGSNLTNANNCTPTATPASAGTFTYNVTVTDNNTCTGTASVTVTVNPLPIVNAAPLAICSGTDGVLTSTLGFQGYSWVPSAVLNLSSTNQSSTTVINPPVGTYTFTVAVVDINSCPNFTTTTLTVNPLPIVTVSPPSSICAGACATVTAGGGVSCAWTGVNLNNSTNCNPSACPTVAGTYPYLATVTDNNQCSDTATAYVTVLPNPVVMVTSNPSNMTVCQDSSVTLTASGAGAGGTYSWSGTGLSSTTTDTTTASPPPGINAYKVIVSTVNGCTDSTTVNITVVNPPTASVIPLNICVGECRELTASGGLYYTWSPDPSFGSSSLNIPNPSVCPPGTTTYTVTVSNGGNCPPVSDTGTVTVHPVPPIFVGTIPPLVGTDTTILAGDTLVLTASGGGISYNWWPETGLNCTTCPQINATPLITTLYYVSATDQYGCRSTDSILVRVDDVLTLYIPSAFTPDDLNSNNTTFYAYGIGIHTFEFYVFDRWGNKVFESTSPYVGWDGTYKGQKVQQDVYVYLAKAKSITGKSITKTGAVTVVK